MFFGKKRTLSIDFGSHFIKFCEGHYDKNRLVIHKAFVEEIRPGTIENGRIIDYDYVKDLLSNVIRSKNIKAKEVSISINSSDIIKRDIEVEVVDSKDQESLIAFEIEKFIPNNIQNYHLQFKKLSSINEEGVVTKKANFMVALMPKDIADTYHKLIVELKMVPKILDIHCNSINKLLNLKHLNLVSETYKESNILLIDIGFSNINTFIIENGFYKFDRRIHSGIKEIESKIEEHSEEIIDEEGFLREVDFEAEDVKEELDYWINETSKIIQFFENSSEGSKIDKIFIYGGGTSIKFIELYFQKHLQIKTSIIDVESFIEFDDSCQLESISAYLNAIAVLITSL